MGLRTLRIERFRGIHSAELSFEPGTTILIGENDCGRSTLLEALALALSPFGAERPTLDPAQFPRAPEGSVGGDSNPVRIELTFGESRAGSWDRPELAALAPVLGARSARARTLSLVLTAASAEGAEPVAMDWQVSSPGGRPSRGDVAALAAVRRMNPLIWLRGSRVVGATGEEDGGGAAERDVTREALGSLERALAGDSSAGIGGVASGYASTHQLLEEWAPGVRNQRPAVRAIVSEIMGRDASPPAGPGAEAPPQPVRPGSAAQQFGIALVVARLVDGLSRSSAPGARPILVIEDPEAHLHPMTLASVWGLFERLGTQKIVTTNSGTMLAAAPLRSLRRLVRDAHGGVREWRVRQGALRKDEMRKVGYHLRTRRGVACFARCWLLVEGETEFWVLPDLARLCGFDLGQEGVVCVEFAQCGLPPLLKLANALGIEWHVLVDGDRAGETYADAVRPFLGGKDPASRLTRLAERDIEHCFWRHGHAAVFRRLAGPTARASGASPTRMIHKAIERHSKPAVAFELLASVEARGPAGPPPPLRIALETCVRLAAGENAVAVEYGSRNRRKPPSGQRELSRIPSRRLP